MEGNDLVGATKLRGTVKPVKSVAYLHLVSDEDVIANIFLELF